MSSKEISGFLNTVKLKTVIKRFTDLHLKHVIKKKFENEINNKILVKIYKTNLS